VFAVAIVYLMIGHTDFIIKKLNGRRNYISISIYRVMRNIGWIMLAAAFLNLIYESWLWKLAYLSIAIFSIYVIRISHRITAEIEKKKELKEMIKKVL